MHEQLRPDPAEGVFETMLARDGRIQALDRHLERLATATTALYRTPLPDDLAPRALATAATIINPYRLRIDAVPRSNGLRTTITATQVDTAQPPDRPVALRPVVVTGGIGGYKWRDRRLIDALGDGDTVPLILDTHDDLLEAGSMNVWIAEADTIVTPPADGRLLPGVTRALLLELARSLGLTATTEPITQSRAHAADAIFVTSSIRHATPATFADGAGPPPQTALIDTIKTALDAVEWS